ncbi:MAG: arginine deiminase family protein [Acidobacteriota bacterium]|nr:arginine deiminase family protein [Acidobacteriota bacterium]
MSLANVAIMERDLTVVMPSASDIREPREKKHRTTAITRGVSSNIAACELTYRCREKVDYEKAASQLEKYCEVLRKYGADVVTLPASTSYPDCCFVQDTAVVLDEVCVVASMGAPTRRGEITGVEKVLSQYRRIEHILLPATLDGGDVVQVGKTLFVGLSRRTNGRGIETLAKIANPFGYKVVPVTVKGGLHLTTACGVIDDETLILNPHWIDACALKGVRQLHVPEEEPWSANMIRIDEVIFVERGAPRTVELVELYNDKIEILDISEFRKAEGSLSCLSIIFKETLQP